MSNELQNLSIAGRQAAAKQDWATVHLCANGILKRDENDVEGLFLLGLVEKAAERPKRAVAAFEAVLRRAPERYDAAVELASQYSMARRNRDVADLLARYEQALENSPKYLDMAATTYTQIGQPEKAWPLYVKANKLQPNVPLLEANLAGCAVYVGELEVAERTYESLLQRFPDHQRHHYQLARVRRAKDTQHIEQMEQLLAGNGLSDDRNVFLCYALGKEYEDLEMWSEAFSYFERAGNGVMSVADYDVATDVAIIDEIIATCNEHWLQDGAAPQTADKKPIFVVGLPRTGTTLTERILSAHSQVESVGETEFVQMVLRRESGVASIEKMTPEMIRAVASKDSAILRSGYLEAVGYRLGGAPIFVDKLPFNVLYLGFIAKAWPEQHIVLLERHPMDACFSMFKQVFTWAYKFSYSLDNLATYYIAYDRLCRHWRELLGERLVTVQYEALVTDQEQQTRRLLDGVGLDFEDACLSFEQQAAPSATASAVQVREKMHAKSVGRWRHFIDQLEPLRARLDDAGIDVS